MNDDKHVALNFAARCAIATACLPRDEYRAKLEALHREMLAALDHKPLTDQEAHEAIGDDALSRLAWPGPSQVMRLVGAIEAAHGIVYAA